MAEPIDIITLLQNAEIGGVLQRANEDLQKVARAVHRTGNEGESTRAAR